MRPGERSLLPSTASCELEMPGDVESENARSQIEPYQELAGGDPRSTADLDHNGRWAGTDDLALEIGDLPTPVPLLRGGFVRVQTIWGHERGQILRVGVEDGFPMAEVLMDRGDRIFIDVARCTPEEE